MRYDLPSEASTSLTIINTALCSLTGWELSLGKAYKDDLRLQGEWVYVLRNDIENIVLVVGKVVACPS